MEWHDLKGDQNAYIWYVPTYICGEDNNVWCEDMNDKQKNEGKNSNFRNDVLLKMWCKYAVIHRMRNKDIILLAEYAVVDIITSALISYNIR